MTVNNIGSDQMIPRGTALAPSTTTKKLFVAELHCFHIKLQELQVPNKEMPQSEKSIIAKTSFTKYK